MTLKGIYSGIGFGLSIITTKDKYCIFFACIIERYKRSRKYFVIWDLRSFLRAMGIVADQDV